MNIVIFDTETTSLNKPFCYNIGYVIVNTDTGEVLLQKEFVVEQIWHNTELFSSAYYAEKRPIYVNRMRAKKIKMNKFGYICREMIKDFQNFDVQGAYAYNADFDEKVFNFCCDWFKCSNPFDTIPIFDIRGYVHHFLAFTEDFQKWCEATTAFTEHGNYSTTAETVYSYVNNQAGYEEEHTALADSLIEWAILEYCLSTFGANLNYPYKAYMSIPRKQEQELQVIIDKSETHKYKFIKRVSRGNKIFLTTK